MGHPWAGLGGLVQAANAISPGVSKCHQPRGEQGLLLRAQVGLWQGTVGSWGLHCCLGAGGITPSERVQELSGWGTWIRGDAGAGVMVGLDNLKDLFQPC